MRNHKIKQRMQDGEKLNGCWIEMYHPVATEIVARAGYDVALIDLEHGPGGFMDLLRAMQAVGEFPCAAMVRVGSCDAVAVKRVLDLGPEGVMAPNVRNREEAEALVAACRYAPDGVRGAAPGIIRATDYGDDTPGHLDFMRRDFLLMAQIETREGLDNAAAIAGVDGIDMLFIGPSDLSASLGQLGDVHSERFKDAYRRIIKAAKDAGKLLGIVPMPGYTLEQLYEDGIDLVLCGCDSMLLKQAAVEDVRAARQAAGREVAE